MWLTFRSGADEGRSVRAVGERFLLGREPDCDLTINDPRVSRHHAFLRVREDGTAEIHDLASANGTLVNAHLLSGPVLLSGGERIQVGDTLLTTSLQPLAGAPTTIGTTPPIATEAGSPSVVERTRLRRTTARATAAAAVAVGIAAAAVVLAVSGAFGGGEKSPREATIPEIVDAVRPSTVVVNALVDGEQAAGGTGWVLDAGQGLIVTNQHVTNEGTSFSIGVAGEQRPATLVGAAPCEDLSLLQVSDTSGLVTLPLGSQGDLRQGQTVVAIGYPGTASAEANLVPTPGVISVVRTRFDLAGVDVPRYPNVIQTDAVINPGNSGGPLVDTASRLVGVNSAGITLLGGRTIQGQGYAIGVDRVKEIVPQLRSGRSIGWTGMNLIHVADPAESAADLSAAGLPHEVGLVVVNAVAGTPAAAAGFGQHPVLITAVNGAPMDGSLAAYCAAIDNGEGASEAVFSVVEPGATEAKKVAVAFD